MIFASLNKMPLQLIFLSEKTENTRQNFRHCFISHYIIYNTVLFLEEAISSPDIKFINAHSLHSTFIQKIIYGPEKAFGIFESVFCL